MNVDFLKIENAQKVLKRKLYLNHSLTTLCFASYLSIFCMHTNVTFVLLPFLIYVGITIKENSALKLIQTYSKPVPITDRSYQIFQKCTSNLKISNTTHLIHHAVEDYLMAYSYQLKSSNIVGFTPECSNIFTKEEIESIFYHELGHIKNRDCHTQRLYRVLIYCTIYLFIITSIISLMSILFNNPFPNIFFLQALGAISFFNLILLYFRMSQTQEHFADLIAVREVKSLAIIQVLITLSLKNKTYTQIPKNSFRHYLTGHPSVSQRRSFALSLMA